MTTNLKGLAATLGMSKTTVSRALNGYPEVNRRTRERVLAAAKELGYEANPMARSLAIGKTNVFGMIFPLKSGDMGDSVFREVVAGMTSALEAKSMSLSVVPVTPESELAAYEQMVRGRRVDGLILNRTRIHDERVAYLAQKNFPFVALGRTELDKPYAWYDFDHEAGMYEATNHLLRLGHKRIALMSAPLQLTFSAKRRETFLSTMEMAGVPVDPSYMIERIYERREGYKAMQDLLALPVRPTAVIVDNHLSGVGVMRALMDAGIKIGEEISVIVWGSIEDSLVGINVTTMDLPDLAKAGAKMVEMLSALRAGVPAEELQVLVQPVLVKGDTTGRAPA